ncbi:MAG TPA: ABC transporter ATP-binding protein [Chloroflexia bacterium]|nr:ABC transporter ATP-binding protein [Chloroflexia bacterium]
MTGTNLNHDNSANARLKLQGLNKRFGELEVLRDISLEAGPGEFVTLLGPSGSGKSTLFNILAGLEKAESGQIWLDDSTAGLKGKFAYMPQRDALLPWRSILDNVILGAELQGKSKKAARSEALALFPEFGLEGFEKSYPFELSGGMRQRAALLRTVLTHRPVLLLDEPFGALDALTRSNLQTWLLQLQAHLHRTILFITHDVEEALLLSDRIYVMSQRPARVVLVQEVTLPQPRSVTSPEFVACKAGLLAALKSTGAL